MIHNTESDTEDTDSLLSKAKTLINPEFRPLINITNQTNAICRTPDCGPSSSAYLKSSCIKSVSESIKDARKKIKEDWDDLKNSSLCIDDKINTKPNKGCRKAIGNEILFGVVIYIEIPNKQRINALKSILISMGATVCDTFSKEVTHVIFKKGTLETYKRAKLLNVHLVSVLWVESCKNSKRKMSEKLFPVDINNDYMNSPSVFRKFLINQSKNLEYDDNAGVLRKKIVRNPPSNNEVLNFETHSRNISANIDINAEEITTSPSELAESSSKESIQLRISSEGSAEKSNEVDADKNNSPLNLENELNVSDENPIDNVHLVSTSKRRLFVNQPMKASFLKITLEDINDNSQSNTTLLPKPYEVKTKTNVKNRITNQPIKRRAHIDNNKVQIENPNYPKSIYAFDQMKLFPVTQGTFKKSQKNSQKNCTLVSTYLHADENRFLKRVVSKLGRFQFKTVVDNHTTHIVAGESNRTINLLKGIAQGCWILKKNWFIESHNAGYWLAEDQYELVEFSKMVQRSRIQRQAFGKCFGLDIFDECGLIFVSESSEPSRTEIIHLIKLCGGKLTHNIDLADIIIGEFNESKSCVSEKWVLDSITIGRCKTKDKYCIRS